MRPHHEADFPAFLFVQPFQHDLDWLKNAGRVQEEERRGAR
jgi:hypothetical protein